MSLKITNLRESHISDAARLVCGRYVELRQQETLLPERYERVEEFLPKLEKLLEEAPGVAATHSGRLVGFMTGYLIPDFMGMRAAYSPEWANAAESEDGRRIYEEMYAQISKSWVESGCFTHAFTLFASDQASLQALQWLSFGFAGVDGIRELDGLGSGKGSIEIRRAREADHAVVAELLTGLERHLASPPIFWPHELGDILEWLRNPKNAMWLAALQGETLGCMGIGPASQEACTIIRDEGTASIVSAFTRETARSGGVATALLEQALTWAREQGYARCTVDFEAMNYMARRFWLKWFRPVCYSLVRGISELTLKTNR